MIASAFSTGTVPSDPGYQPTDLDTTAERAELEAATDAEMTFDIIQSAQLCACDRH